MRTGENGSGTDAAEGDGVSVTLLSAPISAAVVARLRHAVTAAAASAGLSDGALEDFVLAVHELVTNVVRHGGGAGELVLRRYGEVLTCRITDQGPGLDDVVLRLPQSTDAGRRGLWLAQRLTGALVLDSTSGGLAASVTVRITNQSPATDGGR